MDAFLALIRYAEHGKQDRPDANNSLYGGGYFSDLSKHPRLDVSKWNHRSSASGAYGIVKGLYDDAVKAHVVHDFSERFQDAIAQWRIANRVGAQWDIWDGKLDAAFMKLNQTWSSLPGGAGEELTSDEAKQYFWNRLGETAP